MKAEHEPDPAFVENLEWQLRTALRRRERFAEPVSRRVYSVTRAAGLALLCLTVGAAGAVAAGKLQDEEQRELLLMHNGVQLELAESRLTAAQRVLALAETRYAQGIVSQTETWNAQRRLISAQHEERRLALERREIDVTGRRPDDSLSAPPAAGRDFVTARLELEAFQHQELLRLLREELELVKRRFEAGVVHIDEQRAVGLQVDDLQLTLQQVQQRIALRLRYLGGELTAEEVELESLRLAAEGQLRPLQLRQDFLRERLDLELQRLEMQITTEAAVQELRLQLDEVEGAIRLRTLELQMLESKLGREPQVKSKEER